MTKILKLLIGTNNKGKLKEIRDLLPKYIKTYSTADYNLKSPREDGLTFEENSLIKSKYFSKKSKLISLNRAELSVEDKLCIKPLIPASKKKDMESIAA